MAIMDILRRSMSRNSEKVAKFKEAQENMQVENTLQERQKNSNERELERYMEEERQKLITKNLEEFRKHRQAEAMKTTMFDGPMMFKGGATILEGGATVMKNNDRLFAMRKGNSEATVMRNNPNLFSMKNTNKSKGGMFFK